MSKFDQFTPPEVKNEAIISQNLSKMESEMQKVLMKESMGGNAGYIEIRGKEYPCSGANGCFDGETGEIKAFGNWQELDPQIRENYPHFTFKTARFAGENFKRGTTPIVEIYWGDPYLKRKIDENITQEGKDVLRQSAEKYNIKNADNFEGLCIAIEALGGLQGTGKFYSAKELIEKIEKVRKGELFLDHLTRRGGLRDKAADLLAEGK